MNKKEILLKVITELESLREQAIIAATNAHHAAIDEQSVAETQYDTLAIEAAYLAEGQSKRIEELALQIQALKQLSLTRYQLVSIGALVKLEYDCREEKTFFLLPFGAGIQIVSDNISLRVITPSAPLAQAILGKQVDDDFAFSTSDKPQSGFIAHIE